jgi:hypothetical protein
MVHLLLSIALVAGATMLALEVRAAAVGRIEPLVPLELRRLGLAFVSAGFVLIVLGSFLATRRTAPRSPSVSLMEERPQPIRTPH